MNLPGGWELFAVLAVVMVLFGAKRLPDSARSLGRSMRIFKAETKGLRSDDEALPGVARFDPYTGERLSASAPVSAAAPLAPRFDPQTGEPLPTTPDSST